MVVGCGFSPGVAPGGSAGSDGAIAIDARVPTSPVQLVFDNSASTEDLVHFPVLVVLDSTRIDYAKVFDSRTDLRFDDFVHGVPNLAFDVERWDPSGES